MVDAVFDCFIVADDYGMTLEGNAADFTEGKVDYLVRSQINRVSLGVQSFQPEVLEVIGSPHAAEESIRAIRALQDKGFENIQLDLLYNLPGHRMEIWRRDLETLSAIGIKHFTIYLYRIHKDSVQAKLIRTGQLPPPADPESPMAKAMYREAREIAESMGFHMYMVDHFCKPGFENMYNHWNWKVMWTRSRSVLDPTAISTGIASEPRATLGNTSRRSTEGNSYQRGERSAFAPRGARALHYLCAALLRDRIHLL